MNDKKNETYAVVISCTALKRNLYQVELAEADGKIHELKAHIEAVLDYRLVVGKELDEKTFNQLLASTDYQKAYAYAINIIARRLYSEQEIRTKLKMREVTENVIAAVIKKLNELELLNDFTFATAYIEHHLAFGKKSRRQIILELKNRGVSQNIIDELSDLFDQENEQAVIYKELEKVYYRYERKNLTAFELRTKVLTYLGRKGFDYDMIKKQYDYFIEDLAVATKT